MSDEIAIDGVPDGGYVLMTINNNTIGKDVWFDDIDIIHQPSKVIEENHYYPFGLTISNVAAGSVEQPHKYQGNELEKHFGLETMDFHARQYDPQLGRFNNVDPLADQAPGWTPYRMAFNNPILYVDPFGMFETEVAAMEYAKTNGITDYTTSYDDEAKLYVLYTDDKHIQQIGDKIEILHSTTMEEVTITSQVDNNTSNENSYYSTLRNSNWYGKPNNESSINIYNNNFNRAIDLGYLPFKLDIQFDIYTFGQIKRSANLGKVGGTTSVGWQGGFHTKYGLYNDAITPYNTYVNYKLGSKADLRFYPFTGINRGDWMPGIRGYLSVLNFKHFGKLQFEAIAHPTFNIYSIGGRAVFETPKLFERVGIPSKEAGLGLRLNFEFY